MRTTPIVSGLILVAEQGKGDDFGIGSPESFSVFEVAELFGGNIELVSERRGNRLMADLVSSKTEALGWTPEKSLKSYIEFLRQQNWGETGAE